MKALTAKQQRFVEEYLVDHNGARAAIAAGYSRKTAKEIGSENLTKPNIAAAVAEGMAKLAEDTGITARYVLEQAAKLHVRCMGEEIDERENTEPLRDADGEIIPEPVKYFPFNAAGASKALELMGKHVDVQAFKDKVELDGEVSGNFTVSVSYRRPE